MEIFITIALLLALSAFAQWIQRQRLGGGSGLPPPPDGSAPTRRGEVRPLNRPQRWDLGEQLRRALEQEFGAPPEESGPPATPPPVIKTEVNAPPATVSQPQTIPMARAIRAAPAPGSPAAVAEAAEQEYQRAQAAIDARVALMDVMAADNRQPISAVQERARALRSTVEERARQMTRGAADQLLRPALEVIRVQPKSAAVREANPMLANLRRREGAREAFLAGLVFAPPPSLAPTIPIEPP